MGNGECSVISNVKADNFCERKGLSRDVVIANVEISLLGVTGSLGATEYSQIAAAIASVLPNTQASDVKILSATSTGNGVTVSAQIGVKSQTVGIDYTELDTLDAYEAEVQNALSSGTQKIVSALESSEIMSSVHSVTHVDFHHAEIVGNSEIANTMDGPDMITDFADTSAEDVATDSASDSHANAIISVVSVSGYVFAAMGVMLVGFFVATRTNTAQTVPAPVSSAVTISEMEAQESDEVSSAEGGSDDESIVHTSKRTALKGSSLTLENLKELIVNEESALETMLQNGPQL